MVKKTKKKAPAAVKRQAAQAPTELDRTVVPLIKRGEFAILLKKVNASKRVMSEERGSIGGTISDAVETKHLHKGAFGIFRRLDEMSDKKRSELLFHFDYYRELSTWDDQLDLFRASLKEGTAKDLDEDGPEDYFGEDDRPPSNGRRTEAPTV